ncbi:MAG: phosphoketolase family protein [Ilumatobacteraceae bacterium]|nr:phosphoketolase family protein [Acidimicrobiales bacterium]MCB9395685.1 phosphoketolase family protein [Acidimicrobiaceae bacterium]
MATEQQITTGTSQPVELDALDRLWRAANHLAVGQIHLQDNPLQRRPLAVSDLKPRLLGHWGTTPGINLVYAHLQRLIVERDLRMMLVTGPGHGGPALTANTWLEGSFTTAYPSVRRDEAGMRWLMREFSWPRGMPSHAAPNVPGSINEGGELGYSLAHAVGAAFDHPDLVVACIIGDGEAETGPLAASWQSASFLDPVHDGAVLPILHLNGYKIANPTVLARTSDHRLTAMFDAFGWAAEIVDAMPYVDEPSAVHRPLAAALDRAADAIREIQERARAAGGADPSTEVRWPMIVLRSPKGWTGPAEVDGQPVEGTWRSHQVPIDDVRHDAEHRRMLETWLARYRPHELYDDDGAPRADVVGWLPTGDRSLGGTPYANGGRRRIELPLPELRAFAVAVDRPGGASSEPTRVLGRYLDALMDATTADRNFRLFGPDETASNRLDAVYASTGKAWQLPIRDTDEHLSRHGRVVELLSEHVCQGWLEGYLLSGRHGMFSCYEAFVHIVDSMFNQHAKWLDVCRDLDWRRPISSFNYVLTSHVWRQDHNGFSHQDPGFVDHALNKKADVVRAYFPPDANTLLHVADHCLASTDRINIIVSGKQPTPDWLDVDAARAHCDRGIGIWSWASNDCGEPDVVLASAGDVPTVEALAAVAILRQRLPDLRVRYVNVVDLMRLQDRHRHPHGLDGAAYDAMFGTDVPIIFAYHGYPWLIHRLTYRRHSHHHLHVRGYVEEGSTTTPFDMVVRNDLDRFHLVLDVVDRVPGLATRAADLRQDMLDARNEHVRHVTRHGEDLPEIRNWSWPG